MFIIDIKSTDLILLKFLLNYLEKEHESFLFGSREAMHDATFLDVTVNASGEKQITSEEILRIKASARAFVCGWRRRC